MESSDLVCWRCGASLAALLLPLSRREECPACHAELHVCRLCEFFDPAVAKQCREPIAEEVKDKQRANFCGYFQPRPGAYSAPVAHGGDGRAPLEALFGGEAGQADQPSSARKALDDLFGGKR